MRSRVRFVQVFVAACLVGSIVTAAEPKVEVMNEAPAGLSEEIAAAIETSGLRVTGADGAICDVWLVKEIALKPKFKPSLRVKYPFLAGQLIGVLKLAEGTEHTDFRGQPLEPGVYTLRYGLQPDDGNHLGTSEIRDFLVACPPGEDTTAKRIENIKDVFQLGASAAGTTHPAIFLLSPPPDKAFEKPGAKHEAERELVILNVNVKGKDGTKGLDVPISLIVRGKSEG